MELVATLSLLVVKLVQSFRRSLYRIELDESSVHRFTSFPVCHDMDIGNPIPIASKRFPKSFFTFVEAGNVELVVRFGGSFGSFRCVIHFDGTSDHV